MLRVAASGTLLRVISRRHNPWCIALALGLSAAPGCKKSPPPAASEPSATAVAVTTSESSPTFIEDDYARALSEAKQRNVPLFVDVWASWCHTCMSMKQYVLPDPALRPLTTSYVWLAIDSERRSNAPFLGKFASRSLPTLWVIDPGSETPLLKWIGAATATELHDVLADTLRERAAQPSAATSGAGNAEANTEWIRGTRASAAGDAAKAIEHFQRALALATPDWPQRARTVEALSMRLSETENHNEVVELAAREAAHMPASTARLNVVLNAIDAASELPPDAAARGALPSLLQLGTKIADEPGASVLLDDRSSLYLSLVQTLKTTDSAAAKDVAARWSALLDTQAASEQAPERRRVWDPHRVEAYLALGEPARALPMLEQSEREQPQDYNPPARLARVYLTLDRIPDARAAIDRALPNSDGPRKLRLYILKSDILVKAGDKPGARKTLDEALDFARRSELPTQYDKLRESIERKARDLT